MQRKASRQNKNHFGGKTKTNHHHSTIISPFCFFARGRCHSNFPRQEDTTKFVRLLFCLESRAHIIKYMFTTQTGEYAQQSTAIDTHTHTHTQESPSIGAAKNYYCLFFFFLLFFGVLPAFFLLGVPPRDFFPLLPFFFGKSSSSSSPSPLRLPSP